MINGTFLFFTTFNLLLHVKILHTFYFLNAKISFGVNLFYQQNVLYWFEFKCDNTNTNYYTIYYDIFGVTNFFFGVTI